MKAFLRKCVVSISGGIGAGFGAFQAAAAGGVTQDEWQWIVGTGVVAAYLAFKSNTTWLAPARKGESIMKFGPDESTRRQW